jgi:hypothetical protein
LTNSPMKKEFEVVKNMINAKNAIKAKKIWWQINNTLITDLGQNLKKEQMNATDLFWEN